jgi:hypothetical protein
MTRIAALNRRIVLAARPQGKPRDSFRLDQEPIPDLKQGEILLRNFGKLIVDVGGAQT